MEGEPPTSRKTGMQVLRLVGASPSMRAILQALIFMTRKRGIWLVFGAVAVALAAGFVLHRFNPEHHFFYPRCPFYALTGLKCAGCGATRAVHLLLHGDFAGALAQNPLLFIALPFAAVWLLKPAWFRNRVWAWVAVALAVAYTVWRNLRP